MYVAAVVFGGAITPGYSHVAQAVSELVEAGAPNKPLLDIIFSVYNALLLVFGMGLYWIARPSREKTLPMGALALIGLPLFSLLMVPFAMDPVGAPATFAGKMHWVLAGIGFRKRPDLAGFGRFSILMSVVIFVTGGMAAAAPGLHPPTPSGQVTAARHAG